MALIVGALILWFGKMGAVILAGSLDGLREVRTVGGIFGVVTGVNGDVMMIDVGSGTTLRVATRAVAAKVNIDVPEDDAE